MQDRDYSDASVISHTNQ